jgi:hypothetical protein
VKELRALTPEELARAEARLRNPAPGSRIEAAKKYGIDLTLLIRSTLGRRQPQLTVGSAHVLDG